MRALSPGINDPFTAMTCVDRLGQALCRLAQREFPSEYRYDEEDHLRVIVYPVLFGDILDEAFDQVRQYGRNSTAVIIRQLEALERVALVVRRPRDIAATRRQAKLVARGRHVGHSQRDGSSRRRAALRSRGTCAKRHRSRRRRIVVRFGQSTHSGVPYAVRRQIGLSSCQAVG